MSDNQLIVILLLVGCMGMIVGATIVVLLSPKLRKEVWEDFNTDEGAPTPYEYEQDLEDEAPYDQEQDARPANETFGPLMNFRNPQYLQDVKDFGPAVAQQLWHQRQEKK